MPTYAYACTQCGHRFDAVQAFSDASLTECPECGGALRKQYGSIGVTFNGSGFYRTDSRASASGAGGGGTGAGGAGGAAEKGSGSGSGGAAGGEKPTSSPSSESKAPASPASTGS